MGSQCYALVRGSALRVTSLTSRGEPTDRFAVSTSAVKVAVDALSDDVPVDVLRNEQDRRLIVVPEVSNPLGYLIGLDFLRVDPGMLNLLTGVPLAHSADDVFTGFDYNTRLPVASFALEVWSRLAGDSCKAGRRWGYTLFPNLKGGYLTGFRFGNDGLVTFNLVKAQTRRGVRWGYGLYDLDGNNHSLPDVVSRNSTWETLIVTGEPPEQTDGIQYRCVIFGGTAPITSNEPLLGGSATRVEPSIVFGGSAETDPCDNLPSPDWDVVEGGSAPVTSSQIIDGEFVYTSPDIVEGRTA